MNSLKTDPRKWKPLEAYIAKDAYQYQSQARYREYRRHFLRIKFAACAFSKLSYRRSTWTLAKEYKVIKDLKARIAQLNQRYAGVLRQF